MSPSSWRQYGVYLIPPPELMVPLSIAHHVLGVEFGTRLANGFMVHCTIKGFFKLADGASVDTLAGALDDLFARTQAFDVEIQPPWFSPPGALGRSVLLLLDKSQQLQQLHLDVWEIVAPAIASDCLFSPTEGSGPNFRPHITLVQSDLHAEPGLAEQGQALCQFLYDSLPTHRFVAQHMQLLEFESDDWAGPWWLSFRYRQLKGWRLEQR